MRQMMVKHKNEERNGLTYNVHTSGISSKAGLSHLQKLSKNSNYIASTIKSLSTAHRTSKINQSPLGYYDSQQNALPSVKNAQKFIDFSASQDDGNFKNNKSPIVYANINRLPSVLDQQLHFQSKQAAIPKPSDSKNRNARQSLRTLKEEYNNTMDHKGNFKH
mmetsp:Transcript_10322/g.17348  ORF Transcript_10322/g.17348 Transcript_10322/m.17348 type:complete len:163 (-) Transcript_10322:30-518(-)